MALPDTERRRYVEQEIELELLMDFLLADRVMLLSEADREKLEGTETTINHLRETTSGLGVIEKVDFTILDGTTFNWGRLPAAIAYGRIPGQRSPFLTGGIFSQNTIRKACVEPDQIHFFPDLIGEIPGHFSEFDDALGFNISFDTFGRYKLTVGGRDPHTRMTKTIAGPNRQFQVMHAINTAARLNVPHV